MTGKDLLERQSGDCRAQRLVHFAGQPTRAAAQHRTYQTRVGSPHFTSPIES